MKGRIHSIESMGTLDGPGVRCVVFMQGCPMRCIYCHNPDMWDPQEGREMGSSELLHKILRYKPYFRTDGGVTLSGGEPFMQAQFTLDVLKKCKEKGIHTAVDTCGYHINNTTKEALEFTDLIILDIKHTDALKFEQLTGRELSRVLRFLEYAVNRRLNLWIRQVIVPGWNDNEADVFALANLIRNISSLKKVELLPYHKMGVEKWHKRGIPYLLKDTPEVDNKRIKYLQSIIIDSIQKFCKKS